MSDITSRFRVGAIVFVKANLVLHAGDLGRMFGSKAATMWIPGRVNQCNKRDSKNGRAMRYVTCSFFIGGHQEKIKEVGIQATKIRPPDGCVYPDNIIPIDVQALLDTTAPCPTPTQLSQELDEALSSLPLPDEGIPNVPPNCRRVSDPPPTLQPNIIQHGVTWAYNEDSDNIDCNGPTPFRAWSFRDTFGNSYSDGSDPTCLDDHFDYFQLMMPPGAMQNILNLTNEQLSMFNRKPLDWEELICFFGVLILGTRYEFQDRRSLWSTDQTSRFQEAPNLGRTGMSRNRFDEIWRCLRFSAQPPVRPDHMNTEDYRWMLVDDFVSHINAHRAKYFNPSNDLCVDESIIRWYGLGGHWINTGLPMFIAMDRKPEDGCEIQNACDGESGIMLQLHIVKSSRSHLRIDEEASINHGTYIIKKLVSPWANTHRCVFADSYFASVQAAQELFKVGFRFTGVVKTATKGFPYAHLTSLQFGGKGEWKGLHHKGNGTLADPDLLAFAWVDRDRRYFISSHSSLREVAPLQRVRWRQLNPDTNEDPVRQTISIRQPECSKRYYERCGMIDRHNRTRQDDLKLERKYVTHDWSKRVNMSIFGMIVVDAYLAHKGCTGSSETPHEFFSRLANEMIDHGRITRAQKRALQEADAIAANSLSRKRPAFAPISSGFGPHLTPIKKKRSPDKHGRVSTFANQQRCSCCSMKTTWSCSECYLQDDRIVSLCHTRLRHSCWAEHVKRHHGVFQGLSEPTSI